MKSNKKISGKKPRAFREQLDMEFGKRGSKKREEYEASAESFRLGVMLEELRKAQGLTQEQLADKCGTTKTYISRIENDASDIRLSTLFRIVRDGLGGCLRLTVEPLQTRKRTG
jgi:DNA-binding XRE family transcriptional regulator